MSLLLSRAIINACIFVAAIAIYRAVNERTSYYSRLQGKCVVIAAVIGFSAPSILILELIARPPSGSVENELNAYSLLGMVIGIIVGNIVGLVARQFVTAPQVTDDEEEE